jgi:hypothetical protein
MNSKATAAEAANEPILHCPNCNHEIKLTESLAAPLLAETRQRFNEQLAAKDAEVARKTETLRKEQDAVTLARELIEDEVAQRLTAERSLLVAVEAKKAREAVAKDMQTKEAEAAELRKNLEANNVKLAEAQQAQAELMRKERALADEKRELDLTIERRVQASIDDVRARAKQESDEAARLKVFEKDQTIESMTRTIEELKRRAEPRTKRWRPSLGYIASRLYRITPNRPVKHSRSQRASVEKRSSTRAATRISSRMILALHNGSWSATVGIVSIALSRTRRRGRMVSRSTCL